MRTPIDPRIADYAPDEPENPLCPICHAELKPFGVRVQRIHGVRWVCRADGRIFRDAELRADPQEPTADYDNDSDLPF